LSVVRGKDVSTTTYNGLLTTDYGRSRTRLLAFSPLR
jgi:hypothetical protein